MKRSAMAMVGLVTVGLLTAATYMTVNYDPATGGWSGKGDVQVALGMNNKQIQDAVKNNALEFKYIRDETWGIPCANENAHETVYHTFPVHYNVNKTVAYEARKNSKGKDGEVTGFFLDPINVSQGQGHDLDCPGAWVADGEPFMVSGEPGGLQVNGVPLPNTLL